jgi:phosphatidylserine/phosphatidylglycerophosphate/cardiolipin synthase-like enzyme
MKNTALTPAIIDRAIRQHLPKLRKPGVLAVRPGFQITNHQLTGKRAIVATVHTKTSGLPKNQLLPRAINSIPVDVREATPHQRLRAKDPAAAATAQVFGRPQDKEPTWPFEREMPSGQLLTGPKSETQKSLADFAIRLPEVAKAVGAPTKSKVGYVPAPGHPLDPVQITTSITAHVSPDAGFATLASFLQGTKLSLAVGMYDFTSGPILALFKNALTGNKTLQMVLDNPPPNATRDQLDSQTVQELNAALGTRSRIARALAGDDTLVSAEMFPTSYHIKVIVRDRAALWLSSGNLNNSNQPDAVSLPKTQDRDWHVIVEDQTLAALFEAYLNQDFISAQAYQISGNPALTEAVFDAAAKLAAETTPLPPPAPKPTGTVAAKRFANISVKITPLLTPDTLPPGTAGQYVTNMIKLIASAKKTLYVQLQYIESSAATGVYATLLQTIAARVAAGVDVRLIESLEFGEQWAEKMKDAGVDLTASISLQSNVHNKGFVIDSSVVVVSSQNFSPDGIQFNRDAGVIIESAPVAQYFENVFLADWNNKAKPFVAKGVAAPKPKTKRA